MQDNMQDKDLQNTELRDRNSTTACTSWTTRRSAVRVMTSGGSTLFRNPRAHHEDRHVIDIRVDLGHRASFK